MAVSATQRNPQYDLTLTDQSGNVLNLNLTNPLALSHSNYPTGSVTVQEGRGTHSDKTPPYAEEQQEDFSGGTGAKRLSKDRTKYYEGTAETRIAEQVTLPGQETYTTGYVSKQENMPGSVTWVSLLDPAQYVSESFTVGGANEDVKHILIPMRKIGTPPGTLTVKLYTNTGSNPNAAIAGATATLTPANHERGDDFTVYHFFTVTTEATLTASTAYHLVIYSDSDSDDADNHWDVATISTGGNANTSSDGSSWSNSNDHLCYALTPDQNDARTFFVEYKRALYAVKDVHGSNSALWLNGDRGVADDNSGNLSTLVDASKSWAVNAYAGAYAVLIKGPGSQELQPWRLISSNTSTALTLSEPWEVTHTTDTEYVIVGANTWQEVVSDLGARVSSAPAVAGDRMYIPFGDSQFVRTIYQGTDGAGGFQTYNNASDVNAQYLLEIDNNGVSTLWGSAKRSLDDSSVWHFDVLPYPDYVVDYDFKTLTKKGEIAPTNVPWQGKFYTNVTQKTGGNETQIRLAAGFTTGFASHLNLATPVDASKGDRLMALVASDVAISSGDLELHFSGRPDLGQDYFIPAGVVLEQPNVNEQPDALFHWQDKRKPEKVLFYDASGTAPKDWFAYRNLLVTAGDEDTPENIQQFMAFAASDELYIGIPAKFGRIRWEYTTANTQAATASYKGWDGDSWQALTVTDDTISAGKPFGATGSEVDVTITLNDFYHSWQTGGIPTDDSTDQLDSDLYWVQLSFSGAIDALKVQTVWLSGLADNDYHFESMAWAHDQDVLTAYDLTMGAEDYILIGHDRPFGLASFLFDTGEILGDSMTLDGEYTAGDQWTALTGYNDGTGGAASALGDDGDMTWDIPSDWRSTEINGISKYWVRIGTNQESAERHIPIRVISVGNFMDEGHTRLTLEPVKDGSTATGAQVALLTTNSILVGAAEPFNKAHVNVGTSVNNNTATLAVGYWNDSTFTSVGSLTDGTASGGAPLAVDGDIEWTLPEDWAMATINGIEAYWVELTTSANLDGVDLLEIKCKNDATFVVAFPQLLANKFELVTATITATNERRLLKAVKSVGLKVITDNGAQNIFLLDGVHVINEGPTYMQVGENTDRITGLEAYGTPYSVPWVFKENRPYFLDVESNRFVPLKLGELESLRGYNNGYAHTVNDVYIYFNVGRTVQRYLDGSLQNIGPELGEGLPTDLQGDYVQLISYAGQVFLVIDAGTAGYSTIRSYTGGGWHEVYRAPLGLRIYDLAVQTIDGDTTETDRLWVNMGDHLIHLPLPKGSFNPLRNSSFPYRHEAHLTTAWIDFDWPELKKNFRQLRAISENLTSNVKISFDYRLETGGGLSVGSQKTNGWTEPASNEFTISPQDSELFDGSDGKPDTKGYRMQLRLKFMTNSNTTTPVLIAYVLEALMKQGVKYAYNMEVLVDDTMLNSIGVPDLKALAETVDTQLKNWMDDVEILTMNTRYSINDGTLVTLHAYGGNPRALEQRGHSTPTEYHIGKITLLGV